MAVSVVIANYNQLSTLPISLESFALQSVCPEQVIVADDGSCDGSVEWLDALPDDRYPFPLFYVTHKHFGYGLTVIENLAARRVGSGRLMFTNADIVHNKTSVEAHGGVDGSKIGGGYVKSIAMPESQLVRPADVDEFESRFSKFRGGCTNEEYLKFLPENNIYGIWGGNFSVDAKRFHKIGGFNEEYRSLYGGEEADLIQRLKSVSVGPVWVYNSIAYHLSHPSRAYSKEAPGNQKYRREYMR